MVQSLGIPRFAARLSLAPLAALFAVSCGGSDVVDPADAGADARLSDVTAEARAFDAPPADRSEPSAADEASFDARAADTGLDARATDTGRLDSSPDVADARSGDVTVADAEGGDARLVDARADGDGGDAVVFDARLASDARVTDADASVADASVADARVIDASVTDASVSDANVVDGDASLADASDADGGFADADANPEAEGGDGGLGRLGAARRFAVLAGSTITFTAPPPPTLITGDVGVFPGTSIDPFSPGQPVSGTVHAGDPVAQAGQSALTVAYNTLAGLPCGGGNNYTGVDLGGTTLPPGVYCFNSSAGITGNLVLDGQGDPNAEWVFQVGSTLTTATGSTVAVVGGGSACNVYWEVGSSATLGTGTAFVGNIVALGSISLVTGSTVLVGRTLARTGAVTFDSNAVSALTCQ